jgi:hypothetical protein
MSDFSGNETPQQGPLGYSFCPGSSLNPRQTARAKGYTLKSREVIETSQGEQVRLQFVARR